MVNILFLVNLMKIKLSPFFLVNLINIKLSPFYFINFIKLIFSSLDEIISHFFTLYRIKLLIIAFIIFYLIFLFIFIYFIYKFYLFTLSYLIKLQTINMSKDVSHLFNAFPVVIDNYKYMLPDIINKIYNIHGINHYSYFIYANTNDIQTLHSILNYEPEVASIFLI